MCCINLRFTLHHIAVTHSNKLATESEGMSLRSVTDEVDGLTELLLARQRCSFLSPRRRRDLFARAPFSVQSNSGNGSI